jgi:hypothetical protein
MVFAETDRNTDLGILLTRKHTNLQMKKNVPVDKMKKANGISPQISKYTVSFKVQVRTSSSLKAAIDPI